MELKVCPSDAMKFNSMVKSADEIFSETGKEMPFPPEDTLIHR
jgi:hypothetical protein